MDIREEFERPFHNEMSTEEARAVTLLQLLL
jgi:hypothetical protein